MEQGDDAARIRVAIVDNDRLALDALADILENTGAFRVVWRERSARKAVTLCVEDGRWPDVMVVDVSLYDMSAFECCRQIRMNDNVMPMLAISAFPLECFAQGLADAGAQGIADKNDVPTLIRDLNYVADGHVPHSPYATFTDAGESHRRLMARNTPDDDALSLREVQVLELTLRGLSQKEIARALHITPASVRTHSRIARNKLHADTLPQAISIWVIKRYLYRQWCIRDA